MPGEDRLSPESPGRSRASASAAPCAAPRHAEIACAAAATRVLSIAASAIRSLVAGLAELVGCGYCEVLKRDLAGVVAAMAELGLEPHDASSPAGRCERQEG